MYQRAAERAEAGAQAAPAERRTDGADVRVSVPTRADKAGAGSPVYRADPMRLFDSLMVSVAEPPTFPARSDAFAQELYAGMRKLMIGMADRYAA